MIPFNKPSFVGNELTYIQDAIGLGHISGNGQYTKRCQSFFETRLQTTKCLLTTSCTDALEMCAILLDIQPGDEVIIPAYTFVSTANAFVLRGARIVFADSMANHPNLDAATLASLITPRTRAVVVVHYAGIACDMDAVMALAERHNIFVVEDAAQGIESFHNGKALGTIGHLGAFSFHETKNIISGEGGLLIINDPRFVDRAEIIWEKGTNRASFFKGEVNKYGWVDVGSSFLPSDMTAAFLWAQLEKIDDIQQRRRRIWQFYFAGLSALQQEGLVALPIIPDYASNNAHMFYLTVKDEATRDGLLKHLKGKGFLAVFHYLSLHESDFYKPKHDGRVLPNSDRFSATLIRLPFFLELEERTQTQIIHEITTFLHS
jgi:dTDP-4-amino-4,6-dideoxygalactose transaminase